MKHSLLLFCLIPFCLFTADQPSIDLVTHQKGTFLKRHITIEKVEGPDFVAYSSEHRASGLEILRFILTHSLTRPPYNRHTALSCTKSSDTGKIEGYWNGCWIDHEPHVNICERPVYLEFDKDEEESAKKHFELLKALYIKALAKQKNVDPKS